MPGNEPYVAVVGPSDPAPECYALALEVGRLLAEQGVTLVCGGLGGVMEAAALGASGAGGRVLGILPGRDRGDANPYLTVAVATGLGEIRNGLVVRASDAVVSIGGSWGTLSEVALAQRLGWPVVSLQGWSVVDQNGGSVVGPIAVSSPAEAVEVALGIAAQRRARP
ncbi:MAG TPA: TIGR00725 family protein [Acidimicrobiales bacterium]|nr:TIGR00725 family protein [Acidimicrobiales bacterium]